MNETAAIPLSPPRNRKCHKHEPNEHQPSLFLLMVTTSHLRLPENIGLSCSQHPYLNLSQLHGAFPSPLLPSEPEQSSSTPNPQRTALASFQLLVGSISSHQMGLLELLLPGYPHAHTSVTSPDPPKHQHIQGLPYLFWSPNHLVPCHEAPLPISQPFKFACVGDSE